MEVKILFKNGIEFELKLNDNYVFYQRKRFNDEKILFINKNSDFYLSHQYDELVLAYDKDINQLDPYIVSKIQIFQHGKNLLTVENNFSINYELSNINMEETLFFERRITR